MCNKLKIMFMRKIKILFLLMFAFFLSGCAKKPDKIVLSFTSWGSKSEIAILKPLIAEFEEQNPDISVKFIHTPDNYFRKLHLLVASNLTPDVVFVNNIYGALYADNDIFLNLSERMGKDEYLSQEDFTPEALGAFLRGGKLYAIPRDVSNLVIYYNKVIFDKYEVPYPQEDWTFEDFLETAGQLTRDTDGDGKTDLFGISFREELLFWLPYLMSSGGGVINPGDLSDIIIDETDSISAIRFYSDLRNKYHVAPTKSEAGSATMAQLFMQGKLAMHLSGRWFVPMYRRELSFNWDVAGFPRRKTPAVPCDASGWAISARTKHPEEAWQFISFLVSKQSIEKFTKSGLIVPARVDVAHSSVFLDASQPPAHPEVFVRTMERSIPTPVGKNYQEITDILQNSLEPVWSGRVSAGQAVDEKLVERLQKALE